MQNSVPYDTVCRGEDVNHIHMPSVPRLEDLPPAPAGKAGWPWDSQPPVFEENLPDGAHWPRISVVTPSYNQGAFIEETIRSVLLQGYPNLEYFIMDAGSTDNTVEVIRKYEPWLSGWVSEKDRGQAHAVNKGWARATGEVLGWLNSDDFYLPGALAKVAEAWEVDRSPGLIYGDARVADEDSNVRDAAKRMDGYSLIRLLSKFTMPQPAVFVASDLIGEIGDLDETLEYALDYGFFLRAWASPRAAEFSHTPHVLAVSRLHANRKSERGFGKGRSQFVVENLRVLREWGRQHERRLSQEPLLRDAFAVALVRQARFLAMGGRTARATLWILEAFKWSSVASFQYCFERLRNRIRRRKAGKQL